MKSNMCGASHVSYWRSGGGKVGVVGVGMEGEDPRAMYV